MFVSTTCAESIGEGSVLKSGVPARRRLLHQGIILIKRQIAVVLAVSLGNERRPVVGVASTVRVVRGNVLGRLRQIQSHSGFFGVLVVHIRLWLLQDQAEKLNFN